MAKAFAENKSSLIDFDGDKVDVQQGALPIIQDGRLNYGIREPFYSPTEHDNEQILASPVAVDSFEITLTVDPATYVGKLIYLKEGLRFWTGHIVSFVANTVTVDIALDAPFTTDAYVDIGIDDMAVNGSITPVVFTMKPLPKHKWIVQECLYHMMDASAFHDDKFGSLGALTKGLAFKQHTNIFLNAALIKQNRDFAFITDKYQYTNQGNPSGVFGLLVSGVFLETGKGGAVLLNAEIRNDRLEIIVQDNLTGLDSIKAFARGYIQSYDGDLIKPEY